MGRAPSQPSRRRCLQAFLTKEENHTTRGRGRDGGRGAVPFIHNIVNIHSLYYMCFSLVFACLSVWGLDLMFCLFIYNLFHCMLFTADSHQKIRQGFLQGPWDMGQLRAWLCLGSAEPPHCWLAILGSLLPFTLAGSEVWICSSSGHDGVLTLCAQGARWRLRLGQLDLAHNDSEGWRMIDTRIWSSGTMPRMPEMKPSNTLAHHHEA